MSSPKVLNRITIMELLPEETIRYSRQLPIIGVDGQLKLKQASVLCVGAGGLACPALQYLAASGVGRIGILDADVVDTSNLHRQILFNEQDIGQKKAIIISERLRAMNRHVTVDVHDVFFSYHQRDLLKTYDVILDATDNYRTRYLLNDVCRRIKKPLVSASVYQFEAQLSVFNYKAGPCYQCLYPQPPVNDVHRNCSMAGVLGVVPGVAGTLQAAEAIKVLLGLDTVLSGKLLCIDIFQMRFNIYRIPKLDCPSHPNVQFDFNHEKRSALTPAELDLLLKTNPMIQLIDVRELFEREQFHIGGEHVPLGEIEQAIKQFDKTKPIVIYCHAGVRSAAALQLFVDAGFQEVQHLEGGLLQWQATLSTKNEFQFG